MQLKNGLMVENILINSFKCTISIEYLQLQI
jgi:hypothetical protein